ncbi:hypothetical protein ACFX2I_044982 [Malus domestica]
MADATPPPLFSWVEFGFFIGITIKGFFVVLGLAFLVGLFVFLQTECVLSGERDRVRRKGATETKPSGKGNSDTAGAGDKYL